MKLKAIITMLLLLFVAAGAQAFDGNRKGFVLGIGLGYAPNVKTEVEAVAGAGSGAEGAFLGAAEGNEEAMAGQFLIGLGLDEHNVLVYEANAGYYYYENLGFDGDNLDIIQGFNALVWYRYWGAVGSSFFTAVGAGLTYWDTNYSDVNTAEFGFLLGAGFEFTPHLQLGAYMGRGKTSNTAFPPLEFQGTHTNMSILLTAVAF